MLSKTKILDINAAYFNVPSNILMENAGKGSAREIEHNYDLKNKKIQILCGMGNNGGDGFVVARYLAKKNNDIEVILIDKPDKIKTGIAKKNFEKIPQKVRVKKWDNATKLDADIILDAMLGIGIEGELREPYKTIVKRINKIKTTRVALDIPTGLGTKIFVDAELILTFHYLKPKLAGLIPKENLKIVVIDIGIPHQAETHVGPGEVIAYYPKRKKTAHKGQNGKVLIVGGSSQYHGAAILCALGALKSGCDLVYLYGPEANFEVNRKASPEIIVKKYPGTDLNIKSVKEIADFAKECDTVVIGPGLGKSAEVQKSVLALVKNIKNSIVLDADGILTHAVMQQALENKEVLITPHNGEFRHFIDINLPKNIESRGKLLQHLVHEIRINILLKGNVDIIAGTDNLLKFNDTGNPGMAKGGTGDILSGLVGGLMAQGLNGYEASQIAAFWLGYTGDLLVNEKPNFTAMDIVDRLGEGLKEILNQKFETRNSKLE